MSPLGRASLQVAPTQISTNHLFIIGLAFLWLCAQPFSTGFYGFSKIACIGGGVPASGVTTQPRFSML